MYFFYLACSRICSPERFFSHLSSSGVFLNKLSRGMKSTAEMLGHVLTVFIHAASFFSVVLFLVLLLCSIFLVGLPHLSLSFPCIFDLPTSVVFFPALDYRPRTFSYPHTKPFDVCFFKPYGCVLSLLLFLSLVLPMAQVPNILILLNLLFKPYEQVYAFESCYI